jgi:hypothetical protein
MSVGLRRCPVNLTPLAHLPSEEKFARVVVDLLKFAPRPDGCVRITRENGPTIARFKDPAGNILSVLEAD